MTFLDFAASYGLILNNASPDGRWHRCPTRDHTKKRNGAWKWLGDVGFVQNWAEMDAVAVWKADGSTERIDRKEWAKRKEKDRQQERMRHAWASQEAQRLIKVCERLPHPYLAAKGFPASLGLVHPSGDLIIPMRDAKAYGRINTAQRIAADGAKLFLPGGKAKGSVFVIARGARERWLCEGYATGLSLQAALIDLRRPAEIWVCFSAGNLQYVATLIKRPAFVAADNDASKTGQRAAEATGLPWVMPMLAGTDFNDEHQQLGIRHVVDQIRDLTLASVS